MKAGGSLLLISVKVLGQPLSLSLRLAQGNLPHVEKGQLCLAIKYGSNGCAALLRWYPQPAFGEMARAHAKLAQSG